MVQVADIYVWFTHNTWWLWALVPLIVIIVIMRSASVR
jgi:hypothetical protein